MPTSRHAREEVSTFLAREFRQVWAVDRATGKPRYLPDGQADALRAIAKKDWRCPFPDCSVILTTRGGSKRDHFVHLASASHDSGGESEAHLAAKAMIADWAIARKPPAASVREEESVKDHRASHHRIADVMMTWPDGNKTAFEVEYKPFTADHWAGKQADYDSLGMPCAWFLGHTRVRPVPERAKGYGDWSNAVLLPPLAEAIAMSGRHVLVINPTDKMIGTVAGDRDFSSYSYGSVGWIALDHIDDCDIDEKLGVITPTMRLIEINMAALEAGEARRRAAAERGERLALEKRDRIARMQAAQARVWEESALRQRFIDRWGAIPSSLSVNLPDFWAVWAAETHWHGVIYETFLHNKCPADTFTISEVTRAFAANEIRRHPEFKVYFRGLITYLKHLQGLGHLTIQMSANGRVERLVPAGSSLQEVAKIAASKRVNEARDRQDQAETAATRKRALAAAKQAEREAFERQSAARRDVQAKEMADAKILWEKSIVHAAMMDAHGEIPEFISWHAATEDEMAISSSLPDHWHAYLYFAHVDGLPAGSRFTSEDAVRTLTNSDILLRGESDQIDRAIKAYLLNLSQRGILKRIAPNYAGVGTVITYVIR